MTRIELAERLHGLAFSIANYKSTVKEWDSELKKMKANKNYRCFQSVEEIQKQRDNALTNLNNTSAEYDAIIAEHVGVNLTN